MDKQEKKKIKRRRGKAAEPSSKVPKNIYLDVFIYNAF